MRQLDQRFAAQQRNVLIVLDNAFLLFLLPNMTALAQPLDQDIILSVKQIHRRNLLHRMLLAMNSDRTYSTHLLGVIHMLTHSWMQVLPAIVQNRCMQAKFVVREGGDNEVDEGTEDYESLLAEVLERQDNAAECVIT